MTYILKQLVNPLLGFDKAVLAAITPAGGVIAGGFVRWHVADNAPVPGDMDIFCKSVEALPKVRQAMADLGLVERTLNDFYTSYSASFGSQWEVMGDIVVQVVHPLRTRLGRITYGTVEEILDDIDLTVCQCALVDEDHALVNHRFASDQQLNHIRFNRIHDPLRELQRVMKYAKKGYTLDEVQAVTLLNAWSEMPDYKKSEVWYGDEPLTPKDLEPNIQRDGDDELYPGQLRHG